MMNNIFKQIRRRLLTENKVNRYFIYAIGEIVLVVIGILIALQINNWNETQKLSQQEQQLFSKILSDLKIDSASLEKTLDGFKRYQDIIYHIYDEIKGNASYDSTIQYGFIRFTPPYNSIIKNYWSEVDKIMNEQVRYNLSEYLRHEENINLLGIGQFLDLQINFVRPYLTSSNISNLDAIFSIPRYENNHPDRMISYEVMKSQFNTPEFAQMLYELRAKSAASIQSLSALKKANNKLQITITEALTK